ncbi:MAG TPA: DUF3616 domain-containing protein [Polyangiaceae bacterium]|nr:DUF3616 domain-containing protein [Polyangiaceae bacterium]
MLAAKKPDSTKPHASKRWIAASTGGAALLGLGLAVGLWKASPPAGPVAANASVSPVAASTKQERKAERRAARQAARREASRAVAAPPPVAPAADGTLGVRWVRFEGACDASGAVPVDARHFAVADDEDNVLRVYDAYAGGEAVRRTNLSKQIALKKKGEADIEAATSIGDRAFWLTSHGRNAKGDEDPNRSLVITTQLPTLDERVAVEGEVYRELLHDLQQEPSLAPYQLTRASELAPKEPGGLNIEGLTATPDGKLLIGFRSPLAGTRALLVPIENPAALYGAGKVKLGAPIELDLGGLGVRSLSWWRGSYLIAAGSTGAGGPSRLYRWSGPGTEPRIAAESVFEGSNPEAFFSAEDNDQILVLSDDGTRDVGGKPCKKLKSKKHKSFRGVWLTPPVDKS